MDFENGKRFLVENSPQRDYIPGWRRRVANFGEAFEDSLRIPELYQNPILVEGHGIGKKARRVNAGH